MALKRRPHMTKIVGFYKNPPQTNKVKPSVLKLVVTLYVQMNYHSCWFSKIWWFEEWQGPTRLYHMLWPCALSRIFWSSSPQIVAFVTPLSFGWHHSVDLDHVDPSKFIMYLIIINLELNIDDGPRLVNLYMLLTSSRKWKECKFWHETFHPSIFLAC